MLFKIAWRNIWRHTARSMIVVAAISLGLWAGVFVMAFYYGMMEQRVQEVVESEVSHIQIHHPRFKDDNKISLDIANSQTILNTLKQDNAVKAATARYLTAGMIGSAKGNSGVMINGIDPEEEQMVTGLSDRIKEGDYFESVSKYPILMGRKLAEKLKVKIRSKVVLTFQDVNGDITAGAFRVSGLYESPNAQGEEFLVYIKGPDLKEILGNDLEYHEIAILLKDKTQLANKITDYKKNYPGLLVEDWKELVPVVGYMIDTMDTAMSVFIIIILLGVMFGIINTMLMAILERGREIGILMGVGMNKIKIFTTIMIETVLLTMIGVPVGLFLGYTTIQYFGYMGIDFSSFSEALSSYGFATVVYPILSLDKYLLVTGLVFMLSVIASVYPARMALKYKPAEAIRRI